MAKPPESIIPKGAKLTRELLIELGRNAMEPPHGGPGLSVSGVIGASAIAATRKRQIIPQLAFPARILDGTLIPSEMFRWDYSWNEAALTNLNTWGDLAGGRNFSTFGSARNLAELHNDDMTGPYGVDLGSPGGTITVVEIPSDTIVMINLFKQPNGGIRPWFEATNAINVVCDP